MTKSECVDVIAQLAQCLLPFQCAHGRPSLMPLLRLDQLKDEISSTQVCLLFLLLYADVIQFLVAGSNQAKTSRVFHELHGRKT